MLDRTRVAPPTLNLNLPPGATLSWTGLVLPPDLTLDEWKAIGAELFKVGSAIQWWLGDWWRFGEHKYGERAKAAAGRKLHYTFETLMNYGWVAGQVETSLRNEVLSFNHHVAVASLDPKQQKYWLDQAVKRKWSVAHLRGQIHDRRPDDPDDKRANRFALGCLDAAQQAWRLAYLHRLSVAELKYLEEERIAELVKAYNDTASYWAETCKDLHDRIEELRNLRDREEPSDVA
jgi:hypothetical protein